MNYRFIIYCKTPSGAPTMWSSENWYKFYANFDPDHFTDTMVLTISKYQMERNHRSVEAGDSILIVEGPLADHEFLITGVDYIPYRNGTSTRIQLTVKLKCIHVAA